MFTRLKSLFLYPFEREYKKDVICRMIYSTKKYHTVAAYIIIAFQLLLLIRTFLFGDLLNVSARLKGYRCMYAFLIVSIFICLLFIKGQYRQLEISYKKYMLCQVIYLIALCLWSCGITYLDYMGGNDLSVFCYTLMGVAAFMIVEPWVSCLVFLVCFVIVNVLLAFSITLKPYDASVLINTFSTLALASMVAIVSYKSRALSMYRQIINERNYTEIVKMNEILHAQTYTDGLTKLNNRHYLNEKLEDAVVSGEEGMAVMMIDIDEFKKYNDTYGHMEGDMCLVRIADLIKEFVEGEDAYAVRYGGEEFFICFNHCRGREIYDKGMQIRQKVSDAMIKRVDVDAMQVTISVGTCTAKYGMTMEELIRCSDIALYCAKHNGRNQVREYEQM